MLSGFFASLRMTNKNYINYYLIKLVPVISAGCFIPKI